MRFLEDGCLVSLVVVVLDFALSFCSIFLSTLTSILSSKILSMECSVDALGFAMRSVREVAFSS